MEDRALNDLVRQYKFLYNRKVEFKNKSARKNDWKVFKIF